MTDTCAKHSFETATGVCRQCRHPYCSECLVYPFGEKKPPYCVTCALSAGGVRRHGAKPIPKPRKKGLFGRKTVEAAPTMEPGFDDIQIELPSEAFSSPAMTHLPPREVAPEVIAMVQAAETTSAPDSAAESGSVAVAAPPSDSEASLAEWAASISEPNSGSVEEWRKSPSSDAWPDD